MASRKKIDLQSISVSGNLFVNKIGKEDNDKKKKLKYVIQRTAINRTKTT